MCGPSSPSVEAEPKPPGRRGRRAARVRRSNGRFHEDHRSLPKEALTETDHIPMSLYSLSGRGMQPATYATHHEQNVLGAVDNVASPMLAMAYRWGRWSSWPSPRQWPAWSGTRFLVI